MRQPDYDRFFRAYAEQFNRSLADEDGAAEAIAGCYAEHFLAAGADRTVQPGSNGASFLEVLRKGAAFYRRIGTERMNYLRVEATPIDAAHDMARVFFRADYHRPDGSALAIDFDVTYLLQRRAAGPRIFAFVAGDEMALYRQYGLLEAAGRAPA